jgi:hypothetical protein
MYMADFDGLLVTAPSRALGQAGGAENRRTGRSAAL